MSKLKKIIYAEDESDIQEIARLSLEQIGHFELEVCNNGEEVLDKIDTFAPDMIVLDVMMPGMDGVTTYRAIRKKSMYSKTPVVFMTAKVQPHEIQEYINMGAIDVITKPFDPMTLSDELNALWKQHAST